jgi:DNA-binding transcriptional regulator YhcF (GntR family)
LTSLELCNVIHDCDTPPSAWSLYALLRGIARDIASDTVHIYVSELNAMDRAGDEEASTPSLRRSTGPAYLAIVDALSDETLSGALSAGARLLAQRNLADALGVHFTTVTRADEPARRQGLVAVRVGQGRCGRRNLRRSVPLVSSLERCLENRERHSTLIQWGRTLHSAEVRSRPPRRSLRTVLSKSPLYLTRIPRMTLNFVT